MIHHITKSSWGTVIRRIPEAFISNIWIWAIFLIPLLLGVTSLYNWANPEYVSGDPIMEGEVPFLNIPFFVVRQFIYFAIWGFLGYRLHKVSTEMDHTRDWGATSLLRKLSAPGILLFALSVAFASFDWLMTFWLHRNGLLENTIRKPHIHDLASWFFGFTVFYAYIAFSQFILIYYANMPEETLWYYHRLEGSWSVITYMILIGRFVIPFLLLLNRDSKHNTTLLTISSVLVIAMHIIELHWIVMPAIHTEGFSISWLDITTLLGLGGIFMGLFFNSFNKHQIVPVNDPTLNESLSKQYHQ